MARTPITTDIGLFALRATAGGLLIGHGAQKLFGWFEGHGLQGTGGWLESMGLHPGDRWAFAAGAGELGSGLLTALGLFSPAGPLGIFGPMTVATRTVHAGKQPIWVTAGGPELPVMYMAAAGGLALMGPGRLSLDHIFDIRLNPALTALVAALVAGGTFLALTSREEEQQPAQPATSGTQSTRSDQLQTAA